MAPGCAQHQKEGWLRGPDNSVAAPECTRRTTGNRKRGSTTNKANNAQHLGIVCRSLPDQNRQCINPACLCRTPSTLRTRRQHATDDGTSNNKGQTMTKSQEQAGEAKPGRADTRGRLQTKVSTRTGSISWRFSEAAAQRRCLQRTPQAATKNAR